MIRALLLAALITLIPASTGSAGDFGTLGGGIGRVIIYGDSLSNAFNPQSCEWCDPVVAKGLQVWGLAESGAKTYYDFTTDAGECEGPASYGTCEKFGLYQVEYLDGECRRTDTTRFTGDTDATTCLLDSPVSSQDVDVFFFGTNDVRTISVAAWTATFQAFSEAAYDVMLDASEDAGHSCVIVLGPPSFHPNQSPPEDHDVKLVLLHDYLKLEVAANRPTCEIADVYSAFRSVESQHGSEAMYEMYMDCDAGPGDLDCIHPLDGPTAIANVRPNDMMGHIILDAINRTHSKKIAALSVIRECNFASIGVTPIFAANFNVKETVGAQQVARDQSNNIHNPDAFCNVTPFDFSFCPTHSLTSGFGGTGAYTFDTLKNGFLILDTPDMDFSTGDEFTIMAHIKQRTTPAGGNFQGIMFKEAEYYMGGNSAVLNLCGQVFDAPEGSPCDTVSDTAFVQDTDEFEHWAMTWKGDGAGGLMSYFLDGVADGSVDIATGGPVTNTTNVIRIGTHLDDNSVNSRYVADNIMLFDRLLTPAEILAFSDCAVATTYIQV